jgi:hypothetical protein
MIDFPRTALLTMWWLVTVEEPWWQGYNNAEAEEGTGKRRP